MTENFYEHLFGVRGKIALITGGSRGIGRMIAEGLTRCGARVYISSRKVDACSETEQALSQYGYCKALPADISSVAGCQALAREFASHEQQLDILVNNAGLTLSQDIDSFTEKAWDKVANLDVKSPFFLIQALLPQLREAASARSRASVINVSSINAIRPSRLKNYSYVAAKAGLIQLSTELASDLNAEHINVNVIAPGPFKSAMTAPLYADEQAEAEFLKTMPMGRWGEMEDAAGLAIFLSSRAGSFTTGHVIPCDGGATTIL